MSARIAAFAAVCTAVALLGAGYVGLAALRSAGPSVSARAARSPAIIGGTAQLGQELGRPHLVFLQPSGGDPTQNELAVAPLAGPSPRRTLSGLHCSRLYVDAGHGICVGQNAAGVGHLLDAELRPVTTFLQPGLASRARISPNGHWAAATVFVSGHSYAVVGFSTQTLLYDTSTGAATNLESFTVTRDGHAFQSPDFNFWGVTFANGARFYATLGTGGHTYLVEGDLARHTAEVLRDGVECPSVSPDGTRIIYKARVPGTVGQWRLHVLDLRTMSDSALGETRSVDDQAEWLDSRTVLYGLNDQGPPATLDVNLWALPVDGGPPTLYLQHAASPAVARGAP